MTTGFSIKQATKEQVIKYFHEWPNTEQWNPCNSNDVVDLYFASDPSGFFIGTIKNEEDEQETVIAIISAIKHNPDTVFVGHYIVHPDHRGKGYGLAIFDHAVKTYSKEVKYIGLDAVHEQIHNYKKSGFDTETWNSKRYQGDFEKEDLKKRISKSDHYLSATSGLEIKLLSKVPLSSLVQLEKKYTGLERKIFLQNLSSIWNDPSKGKYGLAIVDKNNDEKVLSYGVIRPVQQGYIIGPLYGENQDQISALVYHLIDVIHKASEKSDFQLKNHQSLFAVNVCEKNADAIDLFENEFGWSWYFQCVRMWVGQPPDYDVSGLYGAATYESG